LFDRGHRFDEASERIVTVTRTVEHVTAPAGRVVEQLKYGDLAGDVLVLQCQLR
jgi:hypothetical protein